MDKSSCDAYIYAKVSSRISKAFSGKNSEKLFAVKSLSELYGLLFNEEVPSIPESLLAKEIEIKSERKFVSEYISLLDCYSHAEDLFLDLLQFYDYENLKVIAGSLCLKETGFPRILKLGKYALLKYDSWPDISKITEDSCLSWYNKVPEIFMQQEMDTKLDFQYLSKLWHSVRKMPLNVRKSVMDIFASEISFNNILWALRLKVYYKMTPEEITERLFFEDTSKGENDTLAGEAVKILAWDTSRFDDWKNWKYKNLINSCVDGMFWEVDPRWVENKVYEVQLKKYFSAFHKFPVSSMSLVCYFKIKQNELDNIRRVTEGLRLGGE